MCLASTARRRSLTLQLKPSHCLSSTAEAPPSPYDSACTQQPIAQHKPAPLSSTQDRLVIHHDYHDHANDATMDANTIKRPAKGGVVTPFRKSASVSQVFSSHRLTRSPHPTAFANSCEASSHAG